MINKYLLSYTSFGFSIDRTEFNERLLKHPEEVLLGNLAQRVFYADMLRLRGRFVDIADVWDGHLSFLMAGEQDKLIFYLLCTCIDALGSDTNFKPFDQWLRVKKKKSKYGIDDQMIRTMLEQAGDLKDPDTFRATALRLYEDVYKPQFGNKHSFRKLFLTLPILLKNLLASVYMVVTYPEGVDPLSDTRTREEQLEWWTTLGLDEKMKVLADYVYDKARNPYTHQAQGMPPRYTPNLRLWGVDQEQNDAEVQWQPTFDSRRDDSRKFWIEGMPHEGESHLLRLVIAVAWLSRLGFEDRVDETFLKGFRVFQIRREIMHRAKGELASSFPVLSYYDGQHGMTSYFPNGYEALPYLDNQWLNELTKYWPFNASEHGAPAHYLKAYLTYSWEVRRITGEFNQKYNLMPLGIPAPTSLDRGAFWAMVEERERQYQEICSLKNDRNVPEWELLHIWLNNMADEMWTPHDLSEALIEREPFLSTGKTIILTRLDSFEDE